MFSGSFVNRDQIAFFRYPMRLLTYKQPYKADGNADA
uniref:Uncharacterized protein n=1 Tax=uncultured bacterium 5E7 TaxID=1701324 RepID=A0A0N9HH46_9BACT|nr:hypothetical protein 5E7_034 [uncultured bacterium 5E7]